MDIDKRIKAFARLGQRIANLTDEQRLQLYDRAVAANRWFTADNIAMALSGIGRFLDEDTLTNWLQRYQLPAESKTVGLVMAGNIPLVGFHDMMSVLLAGHRAQVKLSSQDSILPRALADLLLEEEPAFADRLQFVDKLQNSDAVIATGSDNSARYFKKYFGHLPHIIRQNRTSAAVLTGHETPDELNGLGSDIFSYFGLGCRNVAKLYVPQGYDFASLFEALQPYEEVFNHPKYFNNYEYNKAIYLVNRTPHLDTGFALFKEDTGLVSPLAVVYYEEYEDMNQVTASLAQYAHKLQCVVGSANTGRPMVPFGQAQFPAVDDYADNVDTLKFLCQI